MAIAGTTGTNIARNLLGDGALYDAWNWVGMRAIQACIVLTLYGIAKLCQWTYQACRARSAAKKEAARLAEENRLLEEAARRAEEQRLAEEAKRRAAEELARQNEQLIRTATEPDANGMSALGRAMQKHVGRGGSAFGETLTGNSANHTQEGLRHLESILTDPTATRVVRNLPRYFNQFGQNVLDITLPNGMGVRFTEDGSRFIGLLEPLLP